MSLGEPWREAIVVVRDRAPAALLNPPRRTFGERRAVWHVHATTPGELPASRHYVFNLDRLDDVSRARAARAHLDGARITVIVRHVDGPSAVVLGKSGWNVLPAYGDTEHVGTSTLRRALRMVCDGRRVVARGFLENSIPRATGRDVHRVAPFLQLLRDMSAESQTEHVVAAVLAPQRTGSQWLRDLLGWTTGSRVRLFHEHGIPEADEAWPDSQCLSEALALEPDGERRAAMRRAALRSRLLTASRRYIFVTDRDPVERLLSYFVKRRSRWLRDRLDATGRRFGDAQEIERAFAAWLPGQVEHHTRWFRKALKTPFGLDVCRAQPTADGLLMSHHGRNTLVVVPIERLNALRNVVEGEYGSDACAPLADNSAAARGDAALVAAFRRDIFVPPAIEKALREIPEVAYVRSAATGPIAD